MKSKNVTILWNAPCPATRPDVGPATLTVQGDRCIVAFDYVKGDQVIEGRLSFHHTVEHRVTRLGTLASLLRMICGDLYNVALGKVVDIGPSSWTRHARHRVISLRHLVTTFRDSPLYEFLCTAVTYEESVVGNIEQREL